MFLSKNIRMKKLALLTIAIISIQIGNSQTKPVTTLKEKDIYQLLELTKVKESAELLVSHTFDFLKKQNPNIPQSFWDKLESKVDYEKYLLKLVPIYDKTFTHDEIKNMVEFFRTPAGKKYITTLPVVNTEIYEVGKVFGGEIRKMITEQMKENGY